MGQVVISSQDIQRVADRYAALQERTDRDRQRLVEVFRRVVREVATKHPHTTHGSFFQNFLSSDSRTAALNNAIVGGPADALGRAVAIAEALAQLIHDDLKASEREDLQNATIDALAGDDTIESTRTVLLRDLLHRVSSKSDVVGRLDESSVEYAHELAVLAGSDSSPLAEESSRAFSILYLLACFSGLNCDSVGTGEDIDFDAMTDSGA